MVIHESKDLIHISRGNKPILVMFPFGGGNTYSYRNLTRHLDGIFDIICLELPGRNQLIELPLVNTTTGLADFIYSTWIKPLDLNRPCIFYGHSMGALMAYLTVKRMSEKGKQLPFHIVVSGKGAPSISQKNSYHRLPSTEFWNKIEEMGGLTRELIENKEFREYFEPIFRSDFAAVETYTYQNQEPLDIPISVLVGSEENISHEAIQLWQKETIRQIHFKVLPGNHFFIFNHIQYIISYLKNIADKIETMHSELDIYQA